MARKQYRLLDFSRGLNKKDAINLLADNELVQAKNAVLGKGFVKTRNGFEAYSNVLTNPIKSLYQFNKNDGSNEFLSVSGTSLYKDTLGILNSVTMTNVLVSDEVEMLTYKDRNISDVVLIADGGNLKTYNGTNVADVTVYSPSTEEQTNLGLNDLANLTKFRHMAIKKDRLFVAAHPTVKNRLSFCHYDPDKGYAVYDYFPAPFFIDFGDADGDEITKLMTFRDGLTVFLKRSVHILYGDGRTINDYTMHKINVPSGAIASKSVVAVGNFIFYLGNDNVYALYSTDQNFVSAEPISKNVEPILKTISQADKEKAVAYYNDNKYYLSFPNGTTLVYDIDLKSWVEWDLQSDSFIEINDELYFSKANQIFKFNTGYNDNNVAIDYVIETKNIDFGFPINEKKIKNIWIVARQFEAESTNISLDVTVDYVPITIGNITFDESLVWDEGNWDSGYWDFVDVVKVKVPIGKKGTNIQIKISNSNLDEPTEIYGIIIEYKLKKPK